VEKTKLEQRDINLYKKLILLAKKQLTSIDERLSSSKPKKWNEFIFKIRHARIKKILIDILKRREKIIGKDAVLRIIDDLKSIEEDKNDRQYSAKKETDYIRFILHGIKAAPEDNSAEKITGTK